MDNECTLIIDGKEIQTGKIENRFGFSGLKKFYLGIDNNEKIEVFMTEENFKKFVKCFNIKKC